MKASERVRNIAKILDARSLGYETLHFYTCNKISGISYTVAREYARLFGLTDNFCEATLWTEGHAARKTQRVWMLLMFAAVLEEEGR